MTLSRTIRSRLELQGFDCALLPDGERSVRWLRFTPALSTLWIIAGTALRSPTLMWGLAVIAAVGAAGWHLFDALFDLTLRRWVHAPPLGANPAPRRFAMAVAAAWSAGVGILFRAGWIESGIVAGTALALAGLTVATTHFCLGSWLYRLLRLGKDPRHAPPSSG